jgi:AcrR family transcriptional regulator
VNEQEYAARRNEILDVAMRLVYTQGYEQMSIQDILDALGMSKGAFYHYFQSKSDLLEALIERMMEEAEKVIIPKVQDPNRTALEKLNDFLGSSVRWKTDRKDLMMAIMRAWYSDENAILRQKLTAMGISRYSPWINQIIRQGVEEGVFQNRHFEQIGEVIYHLILGLGEGMAARLLGAGPVLTEDFSDSVAAYTDALERVLGAPAGSLVVIAPDILKEWISITSLTAETGETPAETANFTR